MTILDNADKRSLRINGSYPEENKFEKERIFPETIVQIDVGTSVICRSLKSWFQGKSLTVLVC